MKLNNKGFAITAVLYGLLILFVILVSSYLLVLSAKKDRMDDLVNEIETTYNNESIFSQKLSEYITNLYLDNKDQTVTNYSIKYQYAQSVNLMNDRLGDASTDYDAGNIRYYGANPDNYIDIGDRDSSGNVILYRIIGLFKNIELEDGTKENLVKVIRKDHIGYPSWDNKTNGIGSSISNYGSNDWSDSRLMILLNPGYDGYSSTNSLLDASGNTVYGYEGSLWWNSKNGSCYAGTSNTTAICNYASIGLSKGVQDKIETVVWNLGGTSYNNYSNIMYKYERGTEVFKDESSGVERPTEWTGKVALMYSSDYGYATDFNNCNKTLSAYGSSDNSYACVLNNWLYIGPEWQLTTYLGNPSRLWYINSIGSITGVYTNDTAMVRPVFYLNSDTKVISGDGSNSNPYVIK